MFNHCHDAPRDRDPVRRPTGKQKCHSGYMFSSAITPLMPLKCHRKNPRQFLNETNSSPCEGQRDGDDPADRTMNLSQKGRPKTIRSAHEFVDSTKYNEMQYSLSSTIYSARYISYYIHASKKLVRRFPLRFR